MTLTIPDRLQDPPESSRVCFCCGTGGTLGQYIKCGEIVWAHPRCARTKKLEPIDQPDGLPWFGSFES